MYRIITEIIINLSNLTTLKKAKFFNTINFTANPIRGGTPPRLKNCKAISIFFLLSPVAISLNLRHFLVSSLLTAPSNMSEYIVKNMPQTCPINPANIHIPLPTEDKNNMNCKERLELTFTTIKEPPIPIKTSRLISFIPS